MPKPAGSRTPNPNPKPQSPPRRRVQPSSRTQPRNQPSPGTTGPTQRIQVKKPPLVKRAAKAGAKVGVKAATADVAIAKTVGKQVVRKTASAAKGKVAANKANRAAIKEGTQRGINKVKINENVNARPKVQMVTGEYLLAVMLVIIALVWGDGSYHDKMRQFIVQFTGLSAIFFVISIAGVSEKAARVGIMFGALIDLAILFRVVQVKKTATPSAVESKSIASPYWVNDPHSIIGDTTNATPGQGNVGNTNPASPTPSSPGNIPVSLPRTQVAI